MNLAEKKKLIAEANKLLRSANKKKKSSPKKSDLLFKESKLEQLGCGIGALINQKCGLVHR